MAKIAILGFGTVGSGVYEVLCHNAASVSRRAGEPVEVKYISEPEGFYRQPGGAFGGQEYRRDPAGRRRSG